MRRPDDITVYNMMATPFRHDGALDLDAFSSLVDRMCRANTAIYIGSGGAGEAHVLSPDELRRLYRAGVDAAAGRVKVAANPPEPRSAAHMLHLATIAIESGIELVQLYGPDPGHGMVPTRVELERYYRFLLDRLDHPLALSVHSNYGYRVDPQLVADLCAEYAQIGELNLIMPIDYFFAVKAALRAVPREVRLNTSRLTLVEGLYAGSAGCQLAESNLIPHSVRALVDAIATGDLHTASDLYEFVCEFARIVNRWAPSTARWVKMGLMVLDLPGGNGVVREPYVLPDVAQLDEMRRAFDALRVKEVEAAAASRG